MKYREEIDGLRAIAVISVILYHAGFSWFSGGYVGVDVFFVISGYLITSIILTESDSGDFSIVRFYERRVRRILPALFLVMLCCLPIAWVLLLPNQLVDFSKSLVAVPVFLSNVLFWRESGYFDLAADTKPLLHTWSLAVEEQFYVFFPLFILLFRRVGTKWLVGIIGFGAAVSICLAQFGGNLKLQSPYLANRFIYTDVPGWAFYLAPARAWELMLGALSAFYILRVVNESDRPPNSLLLRQTASLIGLALVGFATVVFGISTPFPSFYTLIPVLGTVLIILYADQETLTQRLLSTNALVKIGLISYSAYLWHYPLFAFARISHEKEPSPLTFSLLILLSLALAYVSWRFIERPFRQRGNFSRRQMFAGGLVGSLVFIAAGAIGYFVVLPKVPKTYAKEPLTACKDFVPIGPEAGCGWKPADPNAPSRAPIVIWGDSHAHHYEDVAKLYEGEVYVIWSFGCPPLIGVVRDDKIGTAKDCASLNTLKRYADYINALKPRAVILVGRWNLYLEGWHSRGMLQRETFFLSTNPNAPKNNKAVSDRTVKTQLAQTLDYLRTPQILFVEQAPDLGAIGTAEYIYKRLDETKVSVKDIANYKSHDLAVFEPIVKKFKKARIVPTRDLFCDAESCTIYDGTHLLYFDDNHLSRFGLARVFNRILKYIEFPDAHRAESIGLHRP